MNPPDDLARLRTEYADRARRFAGSDAYSAFNRANLFAVQSRQRAVLDALRHYKINKLTNLRILEMGCGDGGVLAEFRWLGASPENLWGLDLLPERIRRAKEKLPLSKLFLANGQRLPLPDNCFDLTLQFTAISSILDSDLRRDIWAELLRVTRSGGLILSYDFWINPTNPHTRGLGPSEIRQSFINCPVQFMRITLAPPLARRLVPVSWGLACLIESLKLFNSHYLAVVEKR